MLSTTHGGRRRTQAMTFDAGNSRTTTGNHAQHARLVSKITPASRIGVELLERRMQDALAPGMVDEERGLISPASTPNLPTGDPGKLA